VLAQAGTFVLADIMNSIGGSQARPLTPAPLLGIVVRSRA